MSYNNHYEIKRNKNENAKKKRHSNINVRREIIKHKNHNKMGLMAG